MESILITSPEDLKAGDMIKILKRPNKYNGNLNPNNPLDACTFPYILVIENIAPSGYSGQFYAMTCGNFGWSLGAIVEAGCELLTLNIFPFVLYEKEDKYYIKN